jgi:peptidoglycan/xylan/chitin deacetylase (PgdA/CDA1 family)
MFRKLQDSSDGAQWQLREELTGKIGQLSDFVIERFKSVVRFSITQSPDGSMTQCIYNPSMLALALTGAVSAAAVAAGYQSMAPTGQWYGQTFTGLPSGSRHIALTYDDGPNDPHTLRLLEVLAKHNVHATFFLIGRYLQQRPDIAREIVQAGHVVGNHTHTHPLLIFKSEAEIRQQLSQCRSALQDAVGQHSNLFRPPFGGRRPAVLRIARELGLEPVMWNVTGYDWNAPPAAAIERKVAKQIRGGDVILLHDGGHQQMGTDRAQTVIATDHLIARYKAEGYQFVPVPYMLGNGRGKTKSK